MSIEVLQRRFGTIGAGLRCEGPLYGGVPSVDVARRSSTFVLRFPGGAPVDVEVVDVRWRHLLLLVRNGDGKSKFLCGHDERQWFVAAVPENARGVSGVATAMGALAPALVWNAVEQGRRKRRGRTGKRAYMRQGEWFFVPTDDVDPPQLSILRNEPLSRGPGSTPHVVEEAWRRGGELVYVNWQGHVMTAQRYEGRTYAQRKQDPRAPWVRDPELYARGAVRHPDHATIVLRTWHRVVMNTEHEANAMQHVVFLD